MKIAACFTVFNGLELLEASIANIVDKVDHIVICYQETSNKGHKSTELMPFINELQGKKYNSKFEFIEFKPVSNVNTKENERQKHQLMLSYARFIGCSHWILMACDHFYTAEQIDFAKKEVEINDYDVTFTKMFTYYKHPTWQLTPIEDYFMPFLMAIRPESVICNMNYPLLVDPSVKVNTINKWRLFELDEIALHHYSMIRINIRDKFLNAAASIRWGADAAENYAKEFESYDINMNPGVTYFGMRKIKIVANHFNL